MSSIFFILAFFSFFFFSFQVSSLLYYDIYILFLANGFIGFFLDRVDVEYYDKEEEEEEQQQQQQQYRRRLLVSNHKRIVEPCWGDSAGWLRLRNSRRVPSFFFFLFTPGIFFSTLHFEPTPIISAFPRRVYAICAITRSRSTEFQIKQFYTYT